MNKIKSALNFRKNRNLKSKIKLGGALIIVSVITNHLTENTNIPFTDSYDFPLFSIVISIIIGVLILIIADLNFKYYEQKYFETEITPSTLILFLTSTLGYVAIMYIPLYFIVNWLDEGELDPYYFIVGLALTLLLSSLLIIFTFARKVYKLHKLETIEGKLTCKRGGQTFLVAYADISYVYSKNKIVHIVRPDGNTLTTDFTLNEVEDKINEHLFFKANRQTILHYQSIENIKPIENGKLLITLKSTLPNKENHQINISRYKKKAFEKWFASKL